MCGTLFGAIHGQGAADNPSILTLLAIQPTYQKLRLQVLLIWATLQLCDGGICD